MFLGEAASPYMQPGGRGARRRDMPDFGGDLLCGQGGLGNPGGMQRRLVPRYLWTLTFTEWTEQEMQGS